MERTTSLVIYAMTALICAALLITFVSYHRPQATNCADAPMCGLGITSCNDAGTALRTCLVGDDGCKRYIETPCACAIINGSAQCA